MLERKVRLELETEFGKLRFSDHRGLVRNS